MNFDLLRFIDIFGTVSFAVSGVIAAMEKRLDAFGILVIAFITALGGGTLRDIMIGDLPVQWLQNLGPATVISVSTLIAILFRKAMYNLQKPLLIFDSLGLGFFTIVGIHKGLEYGLEPAICIALGTINGCFGGVIRDIALNNIPLIFQKEIYATACIFGAMVYFILLKLIEDAHVAEVVSIVIICMIRLLAVRYKFTFPSIYSNAK